MAKYAIISLFYRVCICVVIFTNAVVMRGLRGY